MPQLDIPSQMSVSCAHERVVSYFCRTDLLLRRLLYERVAHQLFVVLKLEQTSMPGYTRLI